MERNNAERKRACPSTSSLAGDLDRLSVLPDGLLHTIMSFMKARQVVQTCVLSSRWRHLWCSVPSLNIDFDEFKMPDTDNSEDTYAKWEGFGDFAVILMFRRSIAILDSFRLWAPPFAHTEAGRWIRRAMKCCTPEGLSSSSWRLKRLHLCNVFLDGHFTKHVASVCCSLEDLELHSCPFQNIHSITSHSLKNLVLKNCSLGKLSEITSPTLKTLIIDDCRTKNWTHNACPLVILAPTVAYLHLAVRFSYMGGGISINEMPFLAKALIHRRDSRVITISETKLSGHVLKLVCGVSNVKSLELKDFGTMVTGEESKPFQEFKNLRNLLLDNCDLTDDFQTLGLFLENSPNLEKLTLKHCKFSNCYKKKKGTPTSSQCESLEVRCENLKLTEIIYKDDDVRQLVELLLRVSGKVPKNYIKLTKVD